MISRFRADLHTHTTASDGTLKPFELVELAVKYNLQGLAITDHDTISGYESILPFAKERHLPLLSGVEFSASQRGVSVHILGYSFAYDSPVIKAFANRHLERRNLRNQAILQLLAKNHMPLAKEDFAEGVFDEGHPIGRPHIAQAMIKRGYVTSVQQAFHLYLGEEKPCFVSGSAFSVEETLSVIHQAKGLAVIAHPHLIKNSKIVKDLLRLPFDGIEGYYASFPLKEQERWIKEGLSRDWIITGGSDFHGDIKPSNHLGSSWVQEETFQKLMQHLEKNL